MKEKLTKEEYEDVKQLVEFALDAQNKEEAKKYIGKIQSYGFNLYGNAKNIFEELICYLKNASGRVADKEKRVFSAKTTLYKLGNYGVRK